MSMIVHHRSLYYYQLLQVHHLDRYKEEVVEVELKKMSAVHDSHIQAGPPHQSFGEDQVIGVEDRGGTVGEGGSTRTSRERGRLHLGCWSLPRRRW
jgi:hypothetical protein